jgi:chromosome partitioning protein
MVISVTSFKGGVGKSTTAIHLAAKYAELGSTVLVDCDPNQTASEWAQRGKPTFDVVLPGHAKPYMRRDYVIIDSEARPTLSDMSTLAMQSDILILPSTPDSFSVRALMRTLTVVDQVSGVNYAVLLTIVPPGVTDTVGVRRALTEAGIPLLASQIRRLVAFQRSAHLGVTVDQVHDERARDGWRDYERAAMEIEQRVRQTEQVATV